MAKANGTNEKKARKRPGVWEREEREVEMPNVGVVTAKVIVVTFEGHRWEVPDTKEGRHRATVSIQEVRDREKDRRQVERLQARVSLLLQRWQGTAGDVLAKASDHLRTALEHMAKKGE